MVEGFKWVLPGILAGSGRPGLLGNLDTDLEYLRSAGIEMVISLTKEPLALPDGCTLTVLHFPIPDMGISTPRKTKDLCDFILDTISRRQSVLVHCKAGLGRTGTILACLLVSRGSKPENAIQRLRQLTPYYIQSQIQEKFVEHYAAYLVQN